MPDVLPNIRIDRDEWVDLYAVTGLEVGTRMCVQNVGSADVYLTSQADMPENDHDAYNVCARNTGDWLVNDYGDSGAWAYCSSDGGKINVKVV